MSEAGPEQDAGRTRQAALLALLHHLAATGYHFVTISPASHRRVLARHRGQPARTREEVLGWSRAFVPGTIDPDVERLLQEAGAMEDSGGGLRRSLLRVSNVHDRLLLHSAYPTCAEDAVFLGPDSYRFADCIRRELARAPLHADATIVDIGTGSGVGAIVAAGMAPGAAVFMTDINPLALDLAGINAQAAGLAIIAVEGRNLGGLQHPADLIIANPPYIIDPAHRAYRDGGHHHGAAISIEMTRAALAALKPGGRFLLYTGSAIVAGTDLLKETLIQMAREAGCAMHYCEIDPDVFGEELETPHYHDVDRIAVISAVLNRPS